MRTARKTCTERRDHCVWSGWSVPCVSIQLTLSQNMLSRAAHMSKRAQRRRHPPSRRQARTRDRAVMAGTLSHGTTAARGLRLTACMRTSPPTRSNYPRWRESAHSSAGAGCSGASPSTCVLRSVTHCGPILSLTLCRAHANACYLLKGRLRKCLPRADSSLRGPPARRCVPAQLPTEFRVHVTCARAYTTLCELHHEQDVVETKCTNVFMAQIGGTTLLKRVRRV